MWSLELILKYTPSSSENKSNISFSREGMYETLLEDGMFVSASDSFWQSN